MASRKESIWGLYAAVSLHVLVTVKSLCAKELDITVRVVAMARKEVPWALGSRARGHAPQKWRRGPGRKLQVG